MVCNVIRGMSSVLELFPSGKIELYSDRVNMKCRNSLLKLKDILEREFNEGDLDELGTCYSNVSGDWFETKKLLNEACKREREHHRNE